MSSHILYRIFSDEDDIDKTSSMITEYTDDDVDIECSYNVYSKDENKLTRNMTSSDESCYIDSGNEDLNASELKQCTSLLSDIRSYCQTWEEVSKNTLSNSSNCNDEMLNIHEREDMIQNKTQNYSCFLFLQFIFSLFYTKRKK